MKRIGKRAKIRLGCTAGVLLLWTASTPAPATVSVRVEPSTTSVELGTLFTVDLIADLGDEAVIGWGTDLVFDADVVSQVGLPAIGPYWLAGFAPDGDRLTGSVDAFSDPDGDGVFGSAVGNGVLLATLTFSADALGIADLIAGHTPADLNEGFPLDPTGFASVSYRPAKITVIPEPAAGLIVATLLGGILYRRHERPSPGRKQKGRLPVD